MISLAPKPHWVYIAELGNGLLYVGVTNNPARRMGEHRFGTSIRTTRVFGYRRLLHVEAHPDPTPARRRELQLKGRTRAKKLALASGDIEALKRLSQCRMSMRR